MPYNFGEQPNFGSGLAEGASKTLQDFVIPSEENRQKSKLAMQMESARIEGQEKSNIRQATAKQQAEIVSPEELQKISGITSAILSAAHSHTPMPVIDSAGITSQPGQALLAQTFKESMGALSQSARYDKPTVHMVTDPLTGKQTYVAVDPYTGQPTWRQEGGVGNSQAKRVADGRATYFKMQHLADTKEKEITDFASSSTPLQAALQSGTLTLAQVLNTNPEAKATLDQLPFAGMALEKTFLGGLPRSQQMQGSGVNYLFKLNDTVTPPGGVPNPNGGPNIIGSFNLKMKKARQLGYDAARSAYDTVGRPIDSDISDPESSQMLSAPQPKLSASGFAQWKAQQAARPKGK